MKRFLLFASMAFLALFSFGQACNHTFSLVDSYGDGWQGAEFYVNQGGVNIDSFGAASTPFSSGGSASDVIQMSATTTYIILKTDDSWQGEVSFEVFDQWNAASLGGISSLTGFSVGDTVATIVGNCTPPACVVPSGLMLSNVTDNSVDLSWTPPTPAPAAGYEYVVTTTAGTPAGAGTPEPTTAVSVGSLTAQTLYYVYVRSNCGGATSTWVSSSFTTLCSSVSMFPYTQDFSTFTPSCWSEAVDGDLVSGPTGTASNWVQDDWLNTPANGNCARTNIFGTTDDEWLISESFAIPSGRPYRLQYDVAATQWASTTPPSTAWGTDDTVQVLISTTGTTNWTVIETYHAANVPVHTGQTETVDLTAYGGQTVTVAFRSMEGTTSGGDIEFFINDFKVEETPSCEAPSALLASNIASSTADISWTAAVVPPANGYEYFTSTTRGTPMVPGTNVPSGTSVTLMGLTPLAMNYYYVRSDCGGDFSVWIEDSIMTLASCLEPTNLASSAITANAAVLSWTRSTSVPANGYEYIVTTTQGTPAMAGTNVPSDSFVMVSGLNPQTTYYFYVRSDCGGSDFSIWEEGTFTTACLGNIDVAAAPYIADFDALTPNNGSIFSCVAADNLTGCETNSVSNSNNNWVARSSATGSGSTGPSSDHTSGTGNYIYLEASSCLNDTATMLPQSLDLSRVGSPELSFFYHMYGGNMGSLRVEIFNGATWDSLWQLSGDQGNSWQEAVIDLSAYPNANAQLRFTGITGSGFTSDMAIDDIIVQEAPCRDAMSLASSAILDVSATISWSSGGAATQGYNYDFSTTRGTPAGSGISTGATSENLTGLMPSTKYYFYVQSVCAAGTGMWVEDSFTTLNSLDISIANFETPAVLGCKTANETVSVSIRNESGSTVDFSVDNTTVEVITTSQPGTAYSSSLVLSSGTLAPGATQIVVMPDALDMSTPGDYVFQQYVTVSGDGDATNDTLSMITRTSVGDVAAPYCQDFGTGTVFPSDWTSNMTVNATRGNTASGLYKNVWGSSPTATYEMPKIGTVMAGMAYSYDYQLLEYNSNVAHTLTSSIYFEISSDCGVTFTALDSITPTNHTNTSAYSSKNIDLSTYVGNSVIIRMFTNYVSGDFDLHFDNVCIETPAAIDLSAIGITSLSGCNSASQSIDVEIRNNSLLPLDFSRNPVTVGAFTTATAGSAYNSTDVVNTGTLAAGATQIVTMPMTYDMSAAGTYTFTVYTEEAADGDVTNDTTIGITSTTQDAVAGPYCQDFGTTTATPALWGLNGMFVSSSNGNGGSRLTVNHWGSFSGNVSFLMPKVSAGTSDSFSFDYRVVNFTGYPGTATTWSGTGAIYTFVSADCGNTFVLIDSVKAATHTASTSYVRESYALSAYAGQDVIVGVVVVYDGSGDYYVDVDNVCIGEEICEPLATTTAIPKINGSAVTYTATKECLDYEGWTHYFDGSGATDSLLLSLKKNGNDIGTVGDGTFVLELGTGGGAIDQNAATYNIHSNYWQVMNRWYNVAPTTQPATNVGLKFYYTTDDYNDVATATNADSAGSVATHTDLKHYKFLNSTDPNPNLASHAAVTEPDFQFIENAASVTDSTFVYSTFGANHIAEYETVSFSGGGGGASGGTGPVPVELIYFDVNATNGVDAQLEWATASELNNDRFEIYRSYDGENFEYIDAVEGSGTVSGVVKYQMLDRNAARGGNVVFYQLKQVDYDGTYEYTDVRKVNFDNEGGLEENIKVYPNPFTDQFIVSLDMNIESEVSLQILDVQGKVLQTEILEYSGNRTSTVVNATGLPVGVYFIKVESGGVAKTLRLIKSR